MEELDFCADRAEIGLEGGEECFDILEDVIAGLPLARLHESIQISKFEVLHIGVMQCFLQLVVVSKAVYVDR